MADLKTDYKDDVLDTEVNELRKYQMIQNEDGTVSFEDVTEYAQVGDLFGSEILNQIVAKITTDVIDALADVLANTEDGVLVGANAVKELKNTLQNAIDTKVTNSFTASMALVTDASGKVTTSSKTSSTELSYLDGVTGNIQEQLNGKVTNNFTNKSAALFTDANGKVAASSDVSATELGYLNGVTSNIQTQLDGKASIGGNNSFTGSNRFTGVSIGSGQAYIYSEGENVNFRYKNASGNVVYANLRTLCKGSLSGTTLTINLT